MAFGRGVEVEQFPSFLPSQWMRKGDIRLVLRRIRMAASDSKGRICISGC